MQGPDSWGGRPRDLITLRVSELDSLTRQLFKKYIGKRRWTTREEVQRLLATQKIRFSRDPKPEGDPSCPPPII